MNTGIDMNKYASETKRGEAGSSGPACGNAHTYSVIRKTKTQRISACSNSTSLRRAFLIFARENFSIAEFE